MFSKIQMQACLQNDQRTSTPRKWRAALEAMREGGLGGSRVSTSGSHRRQKGGFRHSSVVSYPTLLLTEVPPGTWVPGSQAWQQGLEARWEMPLAVQWGSLWACTWVGGTAGEGVPPRPSARPCVPAEWACRCLLCLPHQDLCDPTSALRRRIPSVQLSGMKHQGPRDKPAPPLNHQQTENQITRYLDGGI